MSPFFSIITVSLNAENLISQTILSTLKQTFTDFEIIVKDGNSTDRTLSVIPADSRIQVFCEKDFSIYDAMNQAIAHARGKYCIFMNCGDIFASDDVLERLYEKINQIDQPSIIYGDYSSKNAVFEQCNLPSDFNLYRTTLCHQSMIIDTNLFSTVGLYNCDYKIMADYDFTLRCHFSGVPLHHVPIIVCNYLGDGVSERPEGISLKKKERSQIIKNAYSKTKRIKYDLFLALTLRKLRIWLSSSHSPSRIRAVYRKLVNQYNHAQ